MGPREQLVDAGIRLLGQDGPEALNARRLAAEIGASTMAVYTYFGGMTGFYEAVVREAFVRFGQRLRRLPRTGDTVADLMALGLDYRDYALGNPHVYRLMFGVTAPGAGLGIGHDLTTEGTPTVLAEVNSTFEQLVEIVRRAMAAGRIRPGDEVLVAGQIWSMIHGYVLLEIAGVFGRDGHGVLQVLAPHAINLLVGLGDEREAAERSALAVAPKAAAPAVTVVKATPRTARRGRRPRPSA